MGVVAVKARYTASEGVIGGVAGGVALGVVSMIGSLILGKGFLYPVVLTGYAFQSYESDPVMSSTILLKAIALHLMVSIAGGLLFVFALNTFMSPRHLWFKGMIMGGLIWSVAVLGGLQTVNSTMAAHLNQNHFGFFLGFIAYGAVMGSYVAWAHRRLTGKHYS